jgi:hypothetical protein
MPGVSSSVPLLLFFQSEARIELNNQQRIAGALGIVALVCLVGYAAYTAKEAPATVIPAPDPVALRNEIVRFHAEASQFLVARNFQIPMSSALSAEGDLATLYNAETGAQFMQRYDHS